VPWPAEEIERFEFVSDFEIQGLKNVFHTYGLGVPMIAVRKPPMQSKPVEQHYAPGLCFPVTALLRCESDMGPIEKDQTVELATATQFELKANESGTRPVKRL